MTVHGDVRPYTCGAPGKHFTPNSFGFTLVEEMASQPRDAEVMCSSLTHCTAKHILEQAANSHVFCYRKAT